jgi:hypothetical protein
VLGRGFKTTLCDRSKKNSEQATWEYISISLRRRLLFEPNQH